MYHILESPRRRYWSLEILVKTVPLLSFRLISTISTRPRQQNQTGLDRYRETLPTLQASLPADMLVCRPDRQSR